MLTVLAFAGNKKGHLMWTCICSCENKTIKDIRGSGLINGTQSCGCLRKELARKACTKHGLSDSPTYTSWCNMIQRCYNKNIREFPNYGGRGIKVCQRFLIFKEFYNDLGAKPNGRTIDKINNDGNYSCGKCEECKRNGWLFNCQWGTRFEQDRNRTNSRYLTYKGKTQILKDWSRELGINEHSISKRLKNGLSVEDALTIPIKKINTSKIIIGSESKSLKQWAEMRNLSYKAVWARVNSLKWDIEEALEFKPRVKNNGIRHEANDNF